MLLSDRYNLQSMLSAHILFFDGTFQFCPSSFYSVSYEMDNVSYQTSGQTYTMTASFAELPERQSNFLAGKLLKVCAMRD
jgi:hypothetical protein